MVDTIGISQASDFIPTVIAQKALGKLEAETHLVKNVSKNFEWTPEKEGRIIQVPKRGTLTPSQKVSGSAVTLQNPSSSKVQVTLDQHWEQTFAVEDIVKTVDKEKQEVQIEEGYMRDAMLGLVEKIETKLAALAPSLTGVSGGLGTAGSDITDAILKSCRSGLSNNRAPKTDRFLYLEPDQVNVILGLDKFVNAEKYGSNMPIMEGEMGKVYGFKTFESLFAYEGAGSPTPVYNIAMHREAMVLATRPLQRPMSNNVKVGYAEKDGVVLRVLMSYNADQLADQITIDCLFGVSTLRPELGIFIKS